MKQFWMKLYIVYCVIRMYITVSVRWLHAIWLAVFRALSKYLVINLLIVSDNSAAMLPPCSKLFYTSASSSSSAVDDKVSSTQAPAAAAVYLPVSVSPSLQPHLYLPHLGWPMINSTSVADKPLSAGYYHTIQVNATDWCNNHIAIKITSK